MFFGERDPSFGDRGVHYRHNRINESWEDFLNGLGFESTSPVREHVRKVFARPDFDAQMQGLFDALSGGAESLNKGDVQRFSEGIQGQLRILLRNQTRVCLCSASAEDRQWIADRFDHVFTGELSLNRSLFPAFAKLVLMRRVVRTLIEVFGVDNLRAGVGAPLVVDITVNMKNGNQPFRVHTVTPSSAPALCTGERLGLIEEASSGTITSSRP